MDSDLAKFEPFTAEDAVQWTADDPKNAAGSILLIRIYLVRDGVCKVNTLPKWACPPGDVIDYGCVVVSEASRTRFRFSTVKGGSGWFAVNDRNKPGAHPVSGNREFGFSRRTAGGWSFYSIGADRATRPMDTFWKIESLRDAG